MGSRVNKHTNKLPKKTQTVLANNAKSFKYKINYDLK